ncbi:MAG: haloacid dehalogenase-like hydrolase [Prevotella sp.]|nr:haloacid dehalogenase-like hydrolase [Prevotella sp.]
MRKVFAFDFDGTITTKDTLLEFIKYAKGRTALYGALLVFLPLLVLMKLRLYSNHKTKEKMFSRLFRGMSLEEFNSLCCNFARDNRHLLRPKAELYINNVLQAPDTEVVIVSASIENWVTPFFADQPSIKVLGTHIEVIDDRLTGQFLSANCYGQEKVNRLLSEYPDRKAYRLTAFGDSSGDRALLAFADEMHYKPFI